MKYVLVRNAAAVQQRARDEYQVECALLADRADALSIRVRSASPPPSNAIISSDIQLFLVL